MTNRDFYIQILQNTSLSREILEFAKQSLQKLDNENERKRNQRKQSQSNNELITNILTKSLSHGRRIIASEIANEYGISAQNASAIMLKLVREGKVKQTEEKIPKRGLTKVYELITTEIATENVDEVMTENVEANVEVKREQ